MITVGAFEAKTKLSELLNRVEEGEEIVITRRGRPVARLTGAPGGPAWPAGGMAEGANGITADEGRRRADRAGSSLKDLLLAEAPRADIPVPRRGRLKRRSEPSPE